MPALANAKHEEFLRFYMKHGSASRAYREAGYSEKGADQCSSRLMSNAKVKARLAELQAEVIKRLDISVEDVLKRWWDTANADPAELTQHRVGSCRYCWGEDHQYQWKTTREFDDAMARWMAESPADIDTRRGTPDYTLADKIHDHFKPHDRGGYGYRISRQANPDCPECDGVGVPHVWMADTRDLSAAARLLYEGVKETAKGREITIGDRAKNLEFVARRLGMLDAEVTIGTTDALAELIAEINAKGSTAPIRKGKSQ